LLTNPSENQQEDKGSIYSTLIGHLNRFNELGLLPKSFLLDRLDEGGAEAALNTNNAQYHKTYIAEKKHLAIGVDEEEKITAHKRTCTLSHAGSDRDH